MKFLASFVILTGNKIVVGYGFTKQRELLDLVIVFSNYNRQKERSEWYLMEDTV